MSGLGSSVTLVGRSVDNDELNLKLRYDTEEKGEVEGKQTKILFVAFTATNSLVTSYDQIYIHNAVLP